MNDCRKCIHFEDAKSLGVEKCHTKFGRYIEQGHLMDNAVLLNARELDIMLDKARADERAKVIEELAEFLKKKNLLTNFHYHNGEADFDHADIDGYVDEFKKQIKQ